MASVNTLEASKGRQMQGDPLRSQCDSPGKKNDNLISGYAKEMEGSGCI